jgi:hypothetical protein
MLRRNVENDVVGNGLKFDCVHGHSSASFATTRRTGPAPPACRHRLGLRPGDLGDLLDVGRPPLLLQTQQIAADLIRTTRGCPCRRLVATSAQTGITDTPTGDFHPISSCPCRAYTVDSSRRQKAARLSSVVNCERSPFAGQWHPLGHRMQINQGGGYGPGRDPCLPPTTIIGT